MTLGRTDHPDVESLDAYADGERNDLAVDRHVRDCPDCAEAVAALRQVRDDLAGLTSVTMPDDVASRIRAALAADFVHTHGEEHPHGEEPAHHEQVPDRQPRRPEQPRGRAQPEPLRPVVGGGGGPGGQARRRGVGGGWRPHHLGSPREWLVAAACLAVVVAIGVVAVDSVSTTTSADLSATGVSGAAPEAATDGDVAAGRASADSDQPDTFGSELSSGTASDSVPFLTPAPTTVEEAPVRAVAPGPTTVSASNEVLTNSEFTEHADETVTVATVLRTTVPVATGEFAFAGAADIPDTAWVTLTSQTAARCYQGLVGTSGGSVLAVDQVRYSGVPSLFVVLSSPTDPGVYVVTVVAATCAVDGDTPSPLITRTVARS